MLMMIKQHMKTIINIYASIINMNNFQVDINMMFQVI